MIKMVYFQLGTTGLNHNKHGVHRITCTVEIDGQIKTIFDQKVQPKRGKMLDPRALQLDGITVDELEGYAPMERAYGLLTQTLDRFISKYDRRDKAFFSGFNAHHSCGFLRRWFWDCGDKYFGSYFHTGEIDIQSLALYALRHRRHLMQGFQLHDVAAQLGVPVDNEHYQKDPVCDIKIAIDILHALERNGLIR